jgi:hypothetical protein
VGKYGTNLEGFGAYEGGVNADKGAPLVSTSSDGATALLFGPAALREIQAGVANGDFAIPPDAAGDTITEENPLPYWTYNSNLSGISAAIATASTAAQQALTFTAAASGAVGSSITLTRYVPIAGNANRNQAYQPEVYVLTGTGTSTDRGRVRLTLTATATDANLTALTATKTNFDTAFNLSNKSLTTDWFTPDATAAFILLTLTVSIPTTSPTAAVTVPITEIRLNIGVATTAFPNAVNPASSPWIVESTDEAGIGTFRIYNAGSTQTNPSLLLEYDETGLTGDAWITADDGQANVTGNTVDISAIDTVNITAPSGAYITVDGSSLGVLNVANVQTTGDLRLLVPGGDVFLHDTAGSNPRLLFRNSSNTFLGGIQMQGANVFRFFNGDVTNDYAYIYAERFYPMNGTTASRYIYDDGTRTHMTGGLDTDGSIVTVGSILNDSISTTTATANAAIWVLSSGTAYTLRRNSSSARYKTNIVDADEAVLEAARKIKPRHYESTIEDEAGVTRLGFIAEEVLAAGLSHAVDYNAEGQVETIDSTALIAALYARVNDLEERLKALESR